MQYDYDVLIVGGGLIGGSLALALKPTAYRTAVVEAVSPGQRQAAPAGDRALALAKGSMQILAQLGVWTSLAPHVVPIKMIHVSDRGHFGKTRLSAEREGVDALGYVITARQLEECIEKTLNESPINLICPAQVMGLKTTPEAIEVSLQQGGESVKVTARLLIAADGSASTVKSLLNIRQSARDYGQTALVTTVRMDSDPAFTAYERFTPSGPLAFLPLGNKTCSVIWTLRNDQAEAMMALSDEAFVRQLQDNFGYRLGRLSLCAPRRAFPLKLILAKEMTAKRVVLIGNAVHQIHPVAGQGFNLGLRDVAQLAELLIDRAAQGEDPGDVKFLGQFAKLRKRDHALIVGFTDNVVRLFCNDWGPLVMARNGGLLTLDHLPWAKHALAKYAMGLAGRRPHLGGSKIG